MKIKRQGCSVFHWKRREEKRKLWKRGERGREWGGEREREDREKYVYKDYSRCCDGPSIHVYCDHLHSPNSNDARTFLWYFTRDNSWDVFVLQHRRNSLERYRITEKLNDPVLWIMSNMHMYQSFIHVLSYHAKEKQASEYFLFDIENIERYCIFHIPWKFSKMYVTSLNNW